LNLRIELPEGYFASVVKEKDWSTLATGVSLLSALIVIALTIWLFLRYGRDDPVIPVVRFDAPQGLSPMDVGYLSDGSVDPKDLSAMVFYWADKGCLSISLPQKKLFQSQEYVFTKIKEPEGGQPYEQDFFDAFFRCGTCWFPFRNEVTRFSKDVRGEGGGEVSVSHGEKPCRMARLRVRHAGILSFLPCCVCRRGGKGFRMWSAPSAHLGYQCGRRFRHGTVHPSFVDDIQKPVVPRRLVGSS
jgi:hypothetical protein